MTRYLLDTNIVSELRKKRPAEEVLRFVEKTPPVNLYFSVLTVGELQKGLAAKRQIEDPGAKSLQQWVDELEIAFGARVLTVDALTARLWGTWAADRSRAVVHTLIAATAVQRGMVLVTRNVRDVHDLPVQILNPWKA